MACPSTGTMPLSKAMMAAAQLVQVVQVAAGPATEGSTNSYNDDSK